MLINNKLATKHSAFSTEACGLVLGEIPPVPGADHVLLGMPG